MNNPLWFHDKPDSMRDPVLYDDCVKSDEWLGYIDGVDVWP